jgi:hypothetical protein
MSHLHFDHAGGLLRADGTKAFARARIVAQRAEWEIALDDNSRIVASYDQPEIQLVRDWGAAGGADGEVELLPGVSVVPTGGPSAGRQASSSAAADQAAARWPSSRPVHATVERQPALVTSFDDFRSIRQVKATSSPAPPMSHGSSSCRTSRWRRWAARRDRDRYAFQAI